MNNSLQFPDLFGKTKLPSLAERLSAAGSPAPRKKPKSRPASKPAKGK